MQMLCKVAAGFSDVRCPVCGQGFLVYWTRNRALGRHEQREALQVALRAQHHLGTESAEIHAPAFQLPDTPVSAAPQPHAESFPSTTVPLYN